MTDFLRIVRGTEPVPPQDAYDVFDVLVPVVLAAPDDTEAVEAAARTIERMPVESPLAVVLDWWLVAATGAASRLGLAFRLPADLLTPPLKDAMEDVLALVEQGIQVPRRWILAARELQERRAALDDDLVLDSYGKTKLPREREVWANLQGQLDATVSALRKGQHTRPFELDERAYEKEMKRCNIQVNSRRWNEMLKRARACVRRVNEAVELQAVVEPWVPRAEPRVVGAVPTPLAAKLGPLGPVLLDCVLPGPPLPATAGPPPSGSPPHDGDATDPHRAEVARVAGRLAAIAAAIADPVAEGSDTGLAAPTDGGSDAGLADLAWLASLADGWMAATGVEVPALAEMTRRRRTVQARIDRLRESGVDTTEAELHLIEHQVGAAERLVDQVEEQRKQQRRGQALAKTIARLRSETWDVAPPERWTERLDEAATLLDQGDHTGAERTVQALDREHRTSRRAAAMTELDHLRNELDCLDAPTSLLVEIDEHLAGLHAHPERSVDAALLRRTAERLDSLRGQRRQEVEASISAAHDALETDRPLFPPDALADLELRLGQVESEFRSGELMAASELADELLVEIQSQRVHRWTVAEGEDALVRHIVGYCRQHLPFTESDIRRLYVAVKTKPFVILAGLTGSGKSTIARLFAGALGADARNGRFRRIAVRPDWIDQSEVLGSINPVSNRFEPGWLADVARQCERNLDQLHVVLLDEMNLAPVEQYLAEFLSAIEEHRSGSAVTSLPLYSPGASPDNAKDWPAALPFPPNLIVLGTVNVDETTRVLSERVLDRANVLQLSVEVSDAHHRRPGRPVQPWYVPFREWDAVCVREPDPGPHELLVDVGAILHGMGIGLGHRSHVELERFVANARGVLEPEPSLDLGVLQRIVPKIRGFKRDLQAGLVELHETLAAADCARSAEVVRQWLDDDVPDDEYLDGTDARIGLLG
jgi:energy-coupling factor transporter ATP-binding protein EcfA2